MKLWADLGKQFSGLVSGLERIVAERTYELDEKTGNLETEIAARAGSETLCPARVLIVEDSEVNQMIASAIIENAGHHVEVEDSGEGALDRLTREQFDVILMDIQMPGMDGLESTRRIRQLPGPVAETHVIALSANVLESTIDECRTAGIDDFVGKPINADTLLNKIADVVSGGAVLPASCHV